MGTQIVTIVVRSVGAAAVATNIRGISTASRSAASSVQILTAALAALGAGAVVNEIGDMVNSFIRLDNQLRFVSKSEEEFTAVQKEILAVANATGAPLETTALLYRRLRAATEDMGVSQREALDFTKGLNAAVLVSGANAQEARAGIIQFTQALQSGRLAGDELRSLLENLTPLAVAMARELGLTLGQFREQSKNIPIEQLFRATQTALAGFSSQLDDVRFTTSQTFEIIRNELTVTLGQLDKFLGGTDSLNAAVRRLGPSIQEGVLDAITAVVRGFAAVIGVGADIVDTLENIGVSTTTVSNLFGNLLSVAKIIFAALGTGFRTVLVGVNAVAAGFLTLGANFGIISERGAAEAVNDLARSLKQLEDSAADTNRVFSDELLAIVNRNIETFKRFGDDNTASTKLRELAGGAKVLADELSRVPISLRSATDADLSATGPNKLTGILSASQLKAIEAANKRIEAIVNRLLVAEQKRVDPLNAQIERLIQQRIELEKQAKIAGVTARVLQGRLLVDQQIAAIQAEQADAGQEVVEQIIELEKNIREIATFAPQMADQLERSANAIVEAGGGSKEVAEGLADVNKESRDFLKERQGLVRELGEGIVTGGLGPFATELRGILQGEAFSFGEALAAAADNLLGNALDALVESAATQFGEIFQNAFGSNVLGGAATSAALGIGLGLLAGAFQDTTKSVTNDLAKSSAIEDIQATRGVVAGPTSIPIFQVGESIEAALIPTNALLTEIRDGILALTGLAPATAAARDPDAETLQRQSPSLI